MSRLSRADSKIIGNAAMQAIRNWKVPDADACAIFGTHRARFAHWESGRFDRIPYPIALRLGLVIRIHLCLRTIFTEPDRGYGLMSRPNEVFGGATPIALIAHVDFQALVRLQDFLQAQKQLW